MGRRMKAAEQREGCRHESSRERKAKGAWAREVMTMGDMGRDMEETMLGNEKSVGGGN